MAVLLLTVFLSLILAAGAMVAFSLERRQRSFGSCEQDALLPFAEERAVDPHRADPPRPQPVSAAAARAHPSPDDRHALRS